MPLIYPITESQANQLKGQEFAPDSFFNPTQDGSGKWFISPEEWGPANKVQWPFLFGIVPVEYVEPVSTDPQ
jgi:hypothetical protein